MKHLQQTMLVLLAAVAIVSCKDDKKEEPKPEPTKAELILGKWEATALKVTPKNGASVTVEPTKEHPIFMTFNKDGSIIHDGWYDESPDIDREEWERTVENGTYTMSDNGGYLTVKDFKDTDILDIKELTTSKLVLGWTKTDGTLEFTFKKI